MPEFGTGDLMILRAIAQRGSFTAAARELGYTQSAISRRAAVLEATAGRPLFQRRPAGVQLTDAGEVLLRHATVVLSALDAAARELHGLSDVRSEPIRLGAFASAAAGLVPSALRALADTRPDLRVVLREGTTAAMVRALRAGTVDMVVVASTQPFRPLDDREPPLAAEVLAERDLLVAVGRATAWQDDRRSTSTSSPVSAGSRRARKATSTCSASGPVSPAGPTSPSSSVTG
jgi:DNA-binding transcriptional LysR family regulator